MRNISIILSLLLLLTACRQENNHDVKWNAEKNEKTDSSEKITRQDVVAVEKVADKQLIVPGKSIGHIFLEQTTDSVLILLGRPDDGDAAMGKATATWYAKSEETGGRNYKYATSVFSVRNMADTVSPKSIVKQIRVTSSFFKTAAGIGTGKGLGDIMQAFPDIKRVSGYAIGSDTFYIYDLQKAGISFEIDTEKICVGVLVHEPGQQGFQTYLSVVKDAKFF